jgi:heterodisulfide reductase subunit A
VQLKADLLVCSVGVDAAENEELATQFKVPRNDQGFFIEAHAKLRPVDFASDGLYLAGLAHYPKSIPETISQAKAAVARAATVLSKQSLRLSGIVSHVNPDNCAVCLTCVRACPYGVPFINENHAAEINPALCHGCGICVAECPAKTITLEHYTQGQIMAKIESLSDENPSEVEEEVMREAL